MQKQLYKEIVLAIIEHITANKLQYDGQLLEAIKDCQYEEVWHGFHVKIDIQNTNGLDIYICPNVEYKEEIVDKIFLDVQPTYKTNIEDEGYLYMIISFPQSTAEVETFCKALIEEYLPNIIAGKDITRYDNEPATIDFALTF